MKLDKNKKVVTIIGAFAIALSACSPSAEEITVEDPAPKTIETSLSYGANNLEEMETTVKASEKSINQKIADRAIITYLGNLYERIDNFYFEYLSADKLMETYEFVKEKGKELREFIFNGKEINGVTFDELSKEGQEKAKEGLNKLDNFIEFYIPDYKEKFHDWTIDKGADAIELWETLQNWYEEYKEEVLEEHDLRAANRIKRK